jgi:hypothetical protein
LSIALSFNGVDLHVFNIRFRNLVDFVNVLFLTQSFFNQIIVFDGFEKRVIVGNKCFMIAKILTVNELLCSDLLDDLDVKINAEFKVGFFLGELLDHTEKLLKGIYFFFIILF